MTLLDEFLDSRAEDIRDVERIGAEPVARSNVFREAIRDGLLMKLRGMGRKEPCRLPFMDEPDLGQ